MKAMDQFNIPSSAPPPPSEVKVRTMHSDLDMMAKSGGGMPQFENVHVAGLSMERGSEAQNNAFAATPDFNSNVPASAAQPQASATSGDHHIVAIVVSCVVVVLIAAVAYMAIYTSAFSGISVSLKKMISGSGTGTAAVVPAATGAAPTAVPISVGSSTTTVPPIAPATTNTQPADTLPLVHTSAFAKPADQVLKVALAGQGSVQSITDLETYGQRLQKAMDSGKQSASLTEIDITSAAGQDLSAADLFGAAGIAILDKNVLSADFDRDATLFVYRDKNGIWPGYVLRLAAGQNALAVGKDAKGMESNSGIASIFLSDAGTPAATFTDSTISNLPAREMTFKGAVTAHFVYGWDKNFLIISASENGFAQAVAHLN